ncbi:MAG: YfiR family protein [Candidatus Eremiobacteraeota bacterium]|nr:YfiR family protein [Candidatus Eremiobacteraeota bacterium]
MKTMKLLAGLMTLTLTMAVFAPFKAEASEAREYAVKAAYLFKFMNLIEWPNEEKISNFAIGVVGPGPFGPSLGDIEGKLVRGKPLRVVTYPMVKSPAPTEQMILFIDRANDAKLEGVLRDLKGQNVLTVGESKEFAERGGCINLVTVKNRVRFRINVDAVRRAQLKISPRLVKIASVLVTDSGKKASYDDYKDILAQNLDEEPIQN